MPRLDQHGSVGSRVLITPLASSEYRGEQDDGGGFRKPRLRRKKLSDQSRCGAGLKLLESMSVRTIVIDAVVQAGDPQRNDVGFSWVHRASRRRSLERSAVTIDINSPHLNPTREGQQRRQVGERHRAGAELTPRASPKEHINERIRTPEVSEGDDRPVRIGFCRPRARTARRGGVLLVTIDEHGVLRCHVKGAGQGIPGAPRTHWVRWCVRGCSGLEQRQASQASKRSP